MMLLPTLDKSCLVSKLTLSTKSSHQPLHIVWKQTFEEYDVADAEKSENDDEVEWGAPKSREDCFDLSKTLAQSHNLRQYVSWKRKDYSFHQGSQYMYKVCMNVNITKVPSLSKITPSGLK